MKRRKEYLPNELIMFLYTACFMLILTSYACSIRQFRSLEAYRELLIVPTFLHEKNFVTELHFSIQKGTKTKTDIQMAKVAFEDKIRSELSFDHPDRKKLQSSLEEYKKIPLNICVIGQPGVGKSSFINAIRNIDRKHPDAAPTDVIETILKATPYEVVTNKNIQYWDVPGEFYDFSRTFITQKKYFSGPGTEQFPKETYLETIEFDRYDTFILMVRENLVEDDIWLMTEIEKVGKKYALVVSKIDIDVEDQLRQEQAENVTLEKIRAHTLENAKTLNNVYLVSNYLENTQRWDFPRLMKDITTSVAATKKEALLNTLMANSKKRIHAKVQKLRRRYWDVLAASAGTTSIPLATIVSEAVLYRKELGLDDDTLAQKCDLHGLSAEQLEARHPELLKDVHELVAYLVESYEAAKLVEKAISTIPIVGPLAASLVDDTVSYEMLEYMLSHFETAAENINNYMIKASKIINS